MLSSLPTSLESLDMTWKSPIEVPASAMLRHGLFPLHITSLHSRAEGLAMNRGFCTRAGPQLCKSLAAARALPAGQSYKRK